MTALDWGLLLLFGLLIGAALDLLLGFGRVAHLAEVAAGPDAVLPPVSIIVAARDEAGGIEVAMRSLLAQRYPRFEVVAVDDRSGDGTGELLDRLAGEDRRLRVIHVAELPSGWLGKNHALARGAALASGAWLLFTDADIVMNPEALARAVAFAESRRLDHLAVMPEVRMPGLFLQAFITVFLCVGAAALRPWKVRDPRSRSFAGIGAFNLVRATAYANVGGHESIRLRPDDDLKLGKILKRAGCRADLLMGRGMLSVDWYPSVRATINGLMKNSFSVVEYRPLVMLGAALTYLAIAFAPLAVVIWGSLAMRVVAAAVVAVELAVLLRGAAEAGVPRRAVLLYPFVNLLFAWIVLRALVLNLAQGGIVWRGTFYSLKELRRNRV